jgi:hypothetical protein
VNYTDGLHLGSGYIPRDFRVAPEGHAAPVFSGALLPWDEIRGRIAEREAAGTTNRALAIAAGLQAKHQGQTNSCWAYNATMCEEFLLLRSGARTPSGGLIQLSPTSTLCRRTNFINRGGWSTDFVEEVQRSGINTEAEWPLNKFQRKFDTSANRTAALTRRQHEFADLPVRGLSAKKRAQIACTVLLTLGPIASGHNWMAHAVTLMDPLIAGNSADPAKWLQWYSWNSGLYRNRQGVTVFKFADGIYDDAVVPTSIHWPS